MTLNEDMKYRLAYLAMRIIFDAKLSSVDDPGTCPGILKLLDILADTSMAAGAAGKKYNSQRDKLDSFLDAEYDDDMLALVSQVTTELV